MYLYLPMETTKSTILFIINPTSGNNTTDWQGDIENYFKTSNHNIVFYDIPKNCKLEDIKHQILLCNPDQIVAVGGDGTIKLVAECIINLHIPLGILPAGSANGLAKELGISDNITLALDVISKGFLKKIHLTYVNNHLCIHLSDIGLNAYAIKQFDKLPLRGMWGYFKAFLQVLWKNPTLEIEMKMGQNKINIVAEMIVIANATKYGSGAIINPIGTLDDELFEVIAIKKISLREIFKMIVSHAPYDTDKTEIFQTDSLTMKSARKVHFQVDGEYLGKTKGVKAELVPKALDIIVPENI